LQPFQHFWRYRSPVGTSIDSGDFEKVLDRALELSNYADFPARRMVAAKHGKLRGIGISCFLEHSGVTPRESAALKFSNNQTILLVLGVQASGQGHETVFGKLAAERHGIPANRVVVVQGSANLALPPGVAFAAQPLFPCIGHSLYF
jgi:carbon-monoxide dehydrogenase large subunit